MKVLQVNQTFSYNDIENEVNVNCKIHCISCGYPQEVYYWFSEQSGELVRETEELMCLRCGIKLNVSLKMNHHVHVEEENPMIRDVKYLIEKCWRHQFAPGGPYYTAVQVAIKDNTNAMVFLLPEDDSSDSSRIMVEMVARKCVVSTPHNFTMSRQANGEQREIYKNAKALKVTHMNLPATCGYSHDLEEEILSIWFENDQALVIPVDIEYTDLHQEDWGNAKIKLKHLEKGVFITALPQHQTREFCRYWDTASNASETSLMGPVAARLFDEKSRLFYEESQIERYKSGRICMPEFNSEVFSKGGPKGWFIDATEELADFGSKALTADEIIWGHYVCLLEQTSYMQKIVDSANHIQNSGYDLSVAYYMNGHRSGTYWSMPNGYLLDDREKKTLVFS